MDNFAFDKDGNLRSDTARSDTIVRRSPLVDERSRRTMKTIVGDLAHRVLIKRQITRQPEEMTMNSCFIADGEEDVRIDVQVSVGMRKLIKIDVETQTFEAEVFTRASWIDPSLEKLYENDERIWFADPHYDDDENMNCWSPRIQVDNLKGDPETLDFWFVPENGTRARDFFKLGRADRVEWRVSQVMKFQGTFLMKMNLRNFPFDEHYLQVKLKSCVPAYAPEDHPLRFGMDTQTNNGMRDVRSNNHTEVRNVLKLSHLKPFTDLNAAGEAPNTFHEDGFFEEWSWWAAPELTLSSVEGKNRDSIHGVTYSTLTARLHVVRDPWAYLINVMLVHGAICTCVLAVVTFDETDARIDSIFQLLTAALAHKFVAIQNLPKLPHATKLDIFIFMGLCLQFAALLETVLITQCESCTVKLDFYFVLIAGMLWALYLVYTFVLLINFWMYGKRVMRGEVQHASDIKAHTFVDPMDPGLPPRACCPCFRTFRSCTHHDTLREKMTKLELLNRTTTTTNSAGPKFSSVSVTPTPELIDSQADVPQQDIGATAF